QFTLLHATTTSEMSTLSLHDALPIWGEDRQVAAPPGLRIGENRLQEGRERDLDRARLVTLEGPGGDRHPQSSDHRRAERRLRQEDRKSTRLNSSHVKISYAVFCLKKK